MSQPICRVSTRVLTFTVEITADNQDDLDEAYADLITAAIDISNSNATASVTVMAPD